MNKNKSVEVEDSQICSKSKKKRVMKAQGKFKTITPQFTCCDDIIKAEQQDSNTRESTQSGPTDR